MKYDKEDFTAPKVVAQAKGELAKKIVEIAIQHNIPIYRDTGLVEKLLELDYYSEIPEDLYRAVAQVIAYIYQIGGMNF